MGKIAQGCRALATGLMVVCLSAGGCAGPLREPARTDDPGIQSLISLRFSSDQRLCRYAITPIVYGRTARLEGKVSGEGDRHRAEAIAREAGALQIDDKLIMDPAEGDPARC
jgi:osmotically-inducible protein OsmY